MKRGTIQSLKLEPHRKSALFKDALPLEKFLILCISAIFSRFSFNAGAESDSFRHSLAVRLSVVRPHWSRVERLVQVILRKPKVPIQMKPSFIGIKFLRTQSLRSSFPGRRAQMPRHFVGEERSWCKRRRRRLFLRMIFELCSFVAFDFT